MARIILPVTDEQHAMIKQLALNNRQTIANFLRHRFGFDQVRAGVKQKPAKAKKVGK